MKREPGPPFSGILIILGGIGDERCPLPASGGAVGPPVGTYIAGALLMHHVESHVDKVCLILMLGPLVQGGVECNDWLSVYCE